MALAGTVVLQCGAPEGRPETRGPPWAPRHPSSGSAERAAPSQAPPGPVSTPEGPGLRGCDEAASTYLSLKHPEKQQDTRVY